MKSISKKKKYADVLVEMLRTTPLSKIRIKDLCEYCGTDRQNFYYYFKDKYELIAWVFQLDIFRSVKISGGAINIKQVTALYTIINERSYAYLKLLSDNSQNSLCSYITDQSQTVLRKMFKDMGYDEFNTRVTASIMINGWLGTTISWLRGEIKLSTEDISRMQYNIIPDIIKNNIGNVDFSDSIKNLD